jgi:hypothetical protein
LFPPCVVKLGGEIEKRLKTVRAANPSHADHPLRLELPTPDTGAPTAAGGWDGDVDSSESHAVQTKENAGQSSTRRATCGDDGGDCSLQAGRVSRPDDVHAPHDPPPSPSPLAPTEGGLGHALGSEVLGGVEAPHPLVIGTRIVLFAS